MNYNKKSIFLITILFLISLVIIPSAHAIVLFNDSFEDGNVDDWTLNSLVAGTQNVSNINFGLNNSLYSFNLTQGFSTSKDYDNLPLDSINNFTYLIKFISDKNTDGWIGTAYIGVGSDDADPNIFIELGIACFFNSANTTVLQVTCDFNNLYTPLVPINFDLNTTYIITYVINRQNSEWYLYINNNYISFNPVSTGNLDGGITITNNNATIDELGVFGDNLNIATQSFAEVDNMCVYNGTYGDCNSTIGISPSSYVPNMTVVFTTPTPANNTIVTVNYTFINVTTSQSATGCTIYFNTSPSAMTNVTGSIFVKNFTNLGNGYYVYYVNCTTTNVSNVSQGRALTINKTISCIENWFPNDTTCNGFNYTKQYVDLNTCGTNLTRPNDSGQIINCTPFRPTMTGFQERVNRGNAVLLGVFLFLIFLALLGQFMTTDEDDKLMANILLVCILALLLIFAGTIYYAVALF